MADTGKDYISNSADPKNIQDLTTFVQNLLQQMQDKFQGMSDQIITRNILFKQTKCMHNPALLLLSE
ncbi:hypothetical protein KUTeg_019228 [Tegillarca granosa]|uniref:Heat shock factor-binding protein 1 n=1 Tax=Tegillarca granosa TaxID=220873 RepID=A0ABQ9EGY2_TEGGR|nr:hypothetical protein KUTeg_019228 [Tegillarca granosa]